MSRDITILGIESSCDETAAAVVVNGRQVLSNEISSQIDIHTLYGGVVPEIASRCHVERVNQVIRAALRKAGKSLSEIDAIAVTYGPGLVGALLVGVSAAKGLSFATGIPLIGVNHIEGHVCANYIGLPAGTSAPADAGSAAGASPGEGEAAPAAAAAPWEPPFVCLIVSGGHTHLVNVRDYGEYEILGQTMDDAAGEAFDKVARAVGLGYPGGPKIDRAAREGNPEAIHFPRGKVGDSAYDFTFSGLKSAVLNYLNTEKMAGRKIYVPDVAASFQAAVVEVLVGHSMQALDGLRGRTGAAGEGTVSPGACERAAAAGTAVSGAAGEGPFVRAGGGYKFALAGGVASNSALRAAAEAACAERGVAFHCPPPVLCTDNAAMIACAGYYGYLRGERAGLDLNAVPNLRLGEKIG